AHRLAAPTDCLRKQRCIPAGTSSGRRHKCPGHAAPRFLRVLVEASPGSRADSSLARKTAAPFPPILFQAHPVGTYELAPPVPWDQLEWKEAITKFSKNLVPFQSLAGR